MIRLTTAKSEYLSEYRLPVASERILKGMMVTLTYTLDECTVGRMTDIRHLHGIAFRDCDAGHPALIAASGSTTDRESWMFWVIEEAV